MGKPIPAEAIPPKILGGYESWMNAFWELSTERVFSESRVNPIPWSSIRAAAEDLGLYGHEVDSFRRAIRRMDSAFMKYFREQTNSAKPLTRESFRELGRRIPRNG